MDLTDWHRPLVEEVERRLDAGLRGLRDVDGATAPEELTAAMGHMLLAGGKRLRPLLVLECARAAAPEGTDEATAYELAFPAAVAVEWVHTYSLIHDDLPALDDDAVRRGRPTLHVKYDEATAILAGDSLLTDAFAFVSQAERNAAEQCLELSRAAGGAGMVGGQYEDVRAEGAPVDIATLEGIHRKKTGRLFVGCCALGGLAVGAPPDVVARLRAYGARFGLSFQIMDDVLDVEGDPAVRGKKAGGDEAHDKMTYVRAYGLEGAREKATTIAGVAIDLATAFGPRGDRLVELARFAVEREK
jgi:geranylgeranyl pyrophosphate synthase